MKICDLVQAYNDRSGGIRTYIDEKRRYLARHAGYRHVLVVPGERREVTSDASGVVYRVPSVPVPGRSPYRLIVDLAEVRSILRGEAPDVIELGTPFVLPAAAFQHRRSHSCLVAGYYHTDVPDAYVASCLRSRLGASPASAAAALARRWEERMYKSCDVVLAATRDNIERLQARGIVSARLVPLGVDTEVFRPEARSDELRASLGAGPGDLLIAYAGRLDEEKRVDLIVEAFQRMRRRSSRREGEVILVLIGEGPRRVRLEETAGTGAGIRVLPYCARREELARHLASADIYVSAGPHETFGLSVAEAQSCGLPVVGVKAGALVDRVPAGTGHLCAPDSVEDLSRSLEEMLRSDYRAMGRAGRALVSSTLSWSRTFGDLCNIYREAAAERRAPARSPERRARETAEGGRVQAARDPQNPARAVSRTLLRLSPVVAAALLVDLGVTHCTAGLSGLRELHALSPPLLALAAALALLPWLIHAARLVIWSACFDRRIGFRQGLRIAWATDLAAAVTPTAVGGAPAKAALLVQGGVSPGAAVLLCGVGTLEDAAAFAVLLPLGLLRMDHRPAALDPRSLRDAMTQLHHGGARLALAAVGLCLLVGVAMVVIARSRKGPWGSGSRGPGPGPEKTRSWWMEFVQQAVAAVRLVRARGRSRFALTLPLAIAQWMARYSVATVLLREASVRLDLFAGILLQWVVFSIMSVAPTPGAAGGAEAAFLAVYSGLVPPERLSGRMIAWRTLTYYLPLILAVSALLALELRLRTGRRLRLVDRLRFRASPPSRGGPAPCRS